MDFNAKTNPGRESRLQQLEEDKVWDVLIIGGGATGAGIAVDAAARGFSTVLFDTQDFSEGTSSRSTKLIHGGVRYMKNPRDWKLVREAMIERKLLLGNAPHIVHPEPFILPCYENFEREYYMAGLCLYGAMAYGGYEVGKTEFLSAAETIRRLPGVKADGLKGGVQFWDAQFDDSRLNIALMKTAEARGALLLNYVPVVGFERGCGGEITVVKVKDKFSGKEYSVKTRMVFNAAGVWADEIRRMVSPEVLPEALILLSAQITLAARPACLFRRLPTDAFFSAFPGTASLKSERRTKKKRTFLSIRNLRKKKSNSCSRRPASIWPIRSRARTS